MWEYKGIDSTNSFSHSRTKGSRNGISNTPGYKAIGELARGVVGAVYNTGYKIGTAVSNGINKLTSNKSGTTSDNAQSNKAHAQQYRDDVARREAEASKKAHAQQYRDDVARREAEANVKGLESTAKKSMIHLDKMNPNSGAFETAKKQFKEDLSKAYEAAENESPKSPAETAKLYSDQIDAYENYTKNGGKLTPSQEIALEVAKERYEYWTTPSKDKPYVSKEYINEVKSNASAM